ncbi:unnamed protein product [Dibothriocephalus latus]|uniref:Uncharacterized protein n=1 Tax=Dibothriocephalus latus TaxID=60516 RepID=A0A3P6V7U1_DIBLA|nr:unnamed protein product [Dibothriocephalus latus]
MKKTKEIRKRGLYSSASVTENAPKCYHGPKLLFEEKATKIQTYACAGFRTARACRKDTEACTAYSLKQTISASQLCSLPQAERCYCHTCNLLFQVFFSLDWLNFLVGVFQGLGVKNVLCVGAPRLFDFLRIHTEGRHTFNTFLLDIDARLPQFYASDVFAQFNMLNGHFFKEDTGRAALLSFFESCDDRSIIFCDPPFSVMLQPLMVTLCSLKESMQKARTGNCNKELNSSDVNTMLVLPYFLGPKLFAAVPSMKMLDYKVTYEGHCRLTSAGIGDNSGSSRRVSIVRLFTDLPPKDIGPPPELESQFRSVR